jgi:hypothetical protein
MAEYTRRAAEVFAQVLAFVRWSQADADGYFAALSRTLTPADYGRVTEDAGKERDHFLKKTTEYFEARKGRLDAIIASVNDICKDAYDRGSADPEARFRGPVDALLEDNRRILGSILSGVDAPTQKAVDLKLRIQKEEEDFCGRLLAKRAPTCWARIARSGRDLTELRQQLMEVWASLRRKTESTAWRRTRSRAWRRRCAGPTTR